MTREAIRRCLSERLTGSEGTGQFRYSPDPRPFGAMNVHTAEANEKRKRLHERRAAIVRAALRSKT